MGFIENIRNAQKIKEMIEDKKTGCAETAAAAMGGQQDVLVSITRMRREGRLGHKMKETDLLRVAGFKVDKFYSSSFQEGIPLDRIQKIIENDNVAGAFVSTCYEQGEGHVFALIARNRAPELSRTLRENQTQIVADINNPGIFRVDLTIEEAMKPEPKMVNRNVYIVKEK